MTVPDTAKPDTANHDTARQGKPGTRPIACALSSSGLAAQADRWRRLGARTMTERAETPHGLRICFRAEPGVEAELRELVAVENECCPWAEWTVQAQTAQVVLDVRAAGDGVATLHAMFDGM
jgi:hypothetical protein